jgi:hypothetical protein
VIWFDLPFAHRFNIEVIVAYHGKEIVAGNGVRFEVVLV